MSDTIYACCDLQTKDTLTLKVSAFGSKCELSEKLLKQVRCKCVPKCELSTVG